jgi:hypothetical protein
VDGRNALSVTEPNKSSRLIWLVRNDGIYIYKEGVLLGLIPKQHFPLLISDMALALDR